MINGIVEQALLDTLPPALPSTQELPIIVADEEMEKEANAPCLIIRATENESIIDPSSGIFKVVVQITLRLHLKESGKDYAASVTRALDEFAFSNPAERLSRIDGFHCYGFMPITGTVPLDPERKIFEYITQWQLWCMPRNNS
jgi:hypothetical protein